MDLDAASTSSLVPKAFGMFSISDTNKTALLNNVELHLLNWQKQGSTKRINVESVLETQFAALQRVTELC